MPDKMLKDIILDYFDVSQLVVAKNCLVDDIDKLAMDSACGQPSRWTKPGQNGG